MGPRIICLLLLFFQLVFAQGQEKRIVQRLKCKADTTQEYALYLPANYVAGTKRPVIIFLDPGARGDFPVNKYSSLADEYGIIMAGSFSSRNFDGTSSVASFVAIYNELLAQHSIDKEQLWVSGFSGGARMAAALAMSYPEVTGVIGCGAGFAEAEESSLKKLKAYAAIGGNRDMNLGELLENNVYLDELKIDNILLQFEGGHQWPPLHPMGLAILWMTGKTGASYAVSASFDSTVRKGIREKTDSGFIYAAWLEAKQLERIPSFSRTVGKLSDETGKHSHFANDKILYERVMEQELKSMNEFSLLFSQLLEGKPVEKNIWNEQAARIEKMIGDKIHYQQLSGQRCHNQTTGSCYEYYFQFIRTRDYAKALNVAEVLACFDPHNSNSYYLIARAEAGLGNKKRSAKQLKEATRKGLVLNKRIEEDTLLLNVFSIEEIKKIIEAR